jgi:D-alanyl-lipoteichoic acid acyltransferase DltB (MBOAT superfamily)
MLFNSYIFFIFIFFFIVFWKVFPRHRVHVTNGASIVFYGAWNPAFVLILLYSASISYWCAIKIAVNKENTKVYILISIISHLLILGLFKYFIFFDGIESGTIFAVGQSYDPVLINAVIPLGISFYTFQTMGYSIDVYRGTTPACRNFSDYFFFVTFFPQLVSGPIERASNILPQIDSIRLDHNRGFDWSGGAMLIFRGAIKKYLVADSLAPYVDLVFHNLDSFSYQSIGLATVFFTVQIYCIFSGYTDIARGLGRLLGIRLMKNFNYPYLATSVRDFWQRWHISLSTWFRDYVYGPLRGLPRGHRRKLRAIMITMVLGGVWYGGAFNFILWGAYHGALLVLQRLWQGWRPKFLCLPGIAAWALTFAAISFGLFIFRLESIDGFEVLFTKTFLANSGRHHLPSLMQVSVFFAFWAVTFVEGGILKRRIAFSLPESPWKGTRVSAQKKVYIVMASALFILLGGFIVLLFSESKQFVYFNF